MSYTEQTLKGVMYQERLHGDVDDTTPLVVVMHWMTGTATVMDFLFEEMPTPARLIFLQAEYPSGYPQGGYSWFPFEGDFYAKSEAEQAPFIQEEAGKIATFIDALRHQHRGKVIVTGMSQGGDLSLHLAVYYGQLIDVAIPCAGRLSAPMRPATVTNTSPIIRMQQGADDEIVSLESAQAAHAWLGERGFDAELDVYAGLDHNMSEEMRARIQAIIGNVD